MILKSIIKTSIVTVAFALTLTVSNFSLLAQFSGGDGTQADPYQIKTKQHLEELADSVNNNSGWSINKYFKQMDNITDTVRTVIGLNNYNKNNAFQGHFDGNWFKIVLGINEVSKSYVGLFGAVYNNTPSVILTIINVTVEGYVKTSGHLGCVGGIVGRFYTDLTSVITIKNCINNCDVTTDNFTNVGGIVAYATNCYIENCINNGKISGKDKVGGIAGCVSTSNSTTSSISHNITNCINNGEISSEYIAGGIVGIFYNTSSYITTNHKIIGCLNIGDIKGKGYDDYDGTAGGIVGVTNADNLEISNCENYGLVVGNDGVGGILGHLLRSTVSNCINGGVVEGKKNVGCIVGKKVSGTVINNHYDIQMCGEE